MNDGMRTGRSTKQLNCVIVCRGSDPVAQVMGPSARRLRAAHSALYRVTFHSLAPPPRARATVTARPAGRTCRAIDYVG